MTETIHIAVVMKPLDGNFAQNALGHGVAGLDIDASRVDHGGEVTARGVYQTQSWKNTSTAGVGSVTDDWKKGRFPANVILEDCESVVTSFPECRGGIWNRTKGARPFDNDGDPTHCQTTGRDDTLGSAARFFKRIQEK